MKICPSRGPRRAGPKAAAVSLAALLCLALGAPPTLPQEEALPAAAVFSPAPAAGGSGARPSPRPQPLPERFALDVPFLSQVEAWPTGCESVSAVMALRYAGADVTVEEFIQGYLPLGNVPAYREDGALVGCDPREKFPGDPASEDGWGCYAPVILQAARALLTDQASPIAVQDLTGASLEDLCRDWVSRGTPVVLWATIGMAEPQESETFLLEDSGEPFTWIYPLHCLVLTGWDEDHYLLNAPLAGPNTPYPKSATAAAYAALGRQALAFAPPPA